MYECTKTVNIHPFYLNYGTEMFFSSSFTVHAGNKCRTTQHTEKESFYSVMSQHAGCSNYEHCLYLTSCMMILAGVAVIQHNAL